MKSVLESLLESLLESVLESLLESLLECALDNEYQQRANFQCLSVCVCRLCVFMCACAVYKSVCVECDSCPKQETQ